MHAWTTRVANSHYLLITLSLSLSVYMLTYIYIYIHLLGGLFENWTAPCWLIGGIVQLLQARQREFEAQAAQEVPL